MMRPILPKDTKPKDVHGDTPMVAQMIVGSSMGHSNTETNLPIPRASSAESSNSGSVTESAPKAKAKRVVVSNACVPCRKRRSKCDGNSPCGKCSSLDRHADCHFDAENDHRRKGALRRENEELKRKSSNLEIVLKANEELKRKNTHLDVILSSLANSDNQEIEIIVKRLRTGENFEDIANTIRPPKQRIRARSTPSEEEYLSADTERETSPSMTQKRPSYWTTVTDDDEFIQELIELYFTWHHTFFLYFSESRFRADFASGKMDNCSSLLVNAILATGCHYSDRPEAREDPDNEDSVGEHFGKEAKTLFEKQKKRPLTTIQALPIMGVRESGMGRDLMGRMFLSLTYRLICDPTYNQIITPLPGGLKDEEAWRITFWGCYCLETEWSFGLGMPNEVNPLVERIPRPSATSETELAPWVPYTGGQKKLIDTRPCLIYTCMNQIITLSDIVQDMTRWLYAPQPFKAGTLMEFHSRLRHWFDQLPEQIRAVDENSIPAVLAVHQFHRIVVLALFRPFVDLPFEPAKNFLSPRELASIAAREEASLCRLYHKVYTFRRATNMTYQFLIPMANARQLDFPLPDARADYIFAVKGMQEAGQAWPFGKVALLSMLQITDVPEDKKKPDSEINSVLQKFESMTIEERSSLTHDSDYYRVIVENNLGNFAPDFESHWRLEWARYTATLADGSVKKPSVGSLLNP